MSLCRIHRLALLLVFLSLPAMLASGCKQQEAETVVAVPASSPSVQDPTMDAAAPPVPSGGSVVEILPAEEEIFPEEVLVAQAPNVEPAAPREWVDDGHDYYQVDFNDLQVDGELRGLCGTWGRRRHQADLWW